MANKKVNSVKEAQLLKEVTEVYERSILLEKDARFNSKLVDAFNQKYPDDKMDKLPWDEKEFLLKESATIMGRLLLSTNELKKMDIEYDRLRKETNEFYNMEILH